MAGFALRADTLYGPGTITISNKEAIMIYLCSPNAQFYIDGQALTSITATEDPALINPHYTIGGPHTLTLMTNTNVEDLGGVYISYGRIKTSAIQSVIIPYNTTNSITVPSGKTVQLYDPFPFCDSPWVTVYAQATKGTGAIPLLTFSGIGYTHPAASGPVTLSIANNNQFGPVVISYYFLTKPRTSPPVDLLH